MQLFIQILTKISEIQNVVKDNKDLLNIIAVLSAYTKKQLGFMCESWVKILIYEENENIITGIEDNAGGIKVIPIEKIFEPFFTYQKLNGSGLGLFMSKLIIEKNMNGELLAENTLNGALLKIIIPQH